MANITIKDFKFPRNGNTYFVPQVDDTLSIEGASADAKETGRQITQNTSDISELKEDLTLKVDKNGYEQVAPKNIQGVVVSGGNILDEAERLYCSQSEATLGNDGYVIVNNGRAIIQNSSGFCSFLIPVKPNTHYTANNSIRFMATLKDLNTTGTTPVSYGDLVTTAALANVTSFDTGEAEYVIVSWHYNSYPINTFVISDGNTPTTEQTIILPDWLDPNAKALKHSVSEITFPKYVSTTGNLSNGTYLALLGYKQNLRKGERYVFSGNITTMETLKFGFTYANSFSVSTTLFNEFTIDSTNITYKTKSTNQTATAQFAHGLTFANNIQFIFEYLPTGQAKITLITNGNMFTQTLAFVKQTISQVAVVSDESTLTDCKLTWTPIDIDKLIWMFGNSYFAYDTARWPYYLHEYGYDKNILIDGWPGEGSVNARNSLLTLIQFGVPKYIVWCMGMNDGSDTDADTPSSDWALRRDEMLEICEQYNITPIFATIPNVPTVLNTGKNAWVRASGYRYIDFAKAVGAEEAQSTWYSGMLSSDNVHPTASGAKALFARVLLDFPEIMIEQ